MRRFALLLLLASTPLFFICVFVQSVIQRSREAMWWVWSDLKIEVEGFKEVWRDNW